MSIVRLVSSSWLVVLVACDPRETQADAAPPDDPPRVTASAPPPASASAPPKAASLRADERPFAASVVALRETSDVVEIEIELGRPLPPTNASRPTLHVGDEIVRRHRYAEGRLDRLVFLVPREQLDRMPDGAALELHGVVLSRDPVPVAGALDKSTLRAP
jgi:hypothetical protein